MTTAFVPAPSLEMREETPVSAAFGDVYFSREGGVAETTHVFLKNNSLPERWERREQATLQNNFTIAELGFGTGLNFLVTLKHFRETAPAGMQLHYHAVEKFPFTTAQLETLLALQPELAAEARELVASYPLRLPGPHRIHLDRAVLNLWFGEVAEWLETLSPQRTSGSQAISSALEFGAEIPAFAGMTDCWYLDGFAPAKNPEMWSDAVFTAIARASAPGATFATFTAASAVRRGLEAAGFVVEKVPGFGRKREMLRGVRKSSPEIAKGDLDLSRGRGKTCLILGAGIAGATLARALAERGCSVTVLEQQCVASGASGNAAGVLFPPLTKRWTISSAFYFAAYDFMLRSIARWKSEGLNFASASPGMLRLPRHAEDAAMLAAITDVLGLDPAIARPVTREEASAISGVPLPAGGAYFPQGTWLSPRELCRALLQHPTIMLREAMTATHIARVGEQWQVACADGSTHAAAQLYITSGAQTAALLAPYGITLQAVGGQVSMLNAPDAAAMPRSILCRKGYVIPLHGRMLVGATYHREALLEVTAARHDENIAELNALLPGWGSESISDGRSAVRATTPDRLPIIGAVDVGLYVSSGHGSRGLLSAPLAAEMIASEIAGEARPVTAQMSAALCPKRFTKV